MNWKQILIWGIAALLAAALCGWVYQTHLSQPAREQQRAEAFFAAGQRYFNHTDNPDGEYNLKKARTAYSEAVQINPHINTAAWYQLGRIDFLEGKFDDALYNFNKQLEYFGDEEIAVFYMIGLTNGYKARATDDPQAWIDAEGAFQVFLQYKPESPWAAVDLAWVYFAQGKYEAMREPIETALTYNPDSPWLLNMQGLVFLNTGEKESAREAFLKAQEGAAALTPEDWGKSYPGNNPDDWPQGLLEFQAVIAKNVELTEGT